MTRFALLAFFICTSAVGSGAQNQPGTPSNTEPAKAPREKAPSSPIPSTMPAMDMPGMEMTPFEGPSNANRPNSAPDLLDEARKRPAMELKDFEEMALANNPTLQMAKDLVERSGGQARQSGLYPNPSVGYEGDEIRGGAYGGGEQGAFIQQTIVLGGKLGLRKRVFEAQQREDEAGVDEQRARVLGDVEQRFYAALAAQEISRLRGQLAALARDAQQTAHQLGNVGQADLPDVLQAEVEAEQAAVDYTTAQMNYLQSFESLATTAGKPALAICLLKGELTALPQIDSRIVESILRDSPSVKRAQQGVAEAEAKLRSARREAVPDLRLRAGVQQDGELLNVAAPRPAPVGIISFASAGIDIPIFNRNQGNVAAASAELARAREEVTRVQLLLRRAAAPLLRSYLARASEAAHYQSEMIPKATRAYQLYLSNYRQMAAAYPQVLISQRTLFQLQVGYLEVLEQAWQSAAALKSFALTDGLLAPLPSGSPSTSINLPGGGGPYAD